MQADVSRTPDAPRADTVEQIGEHLVPDPYRWLENAEDPRTVRWCAEQDRLFAAARAAWAPVCEWFLTDLFTLTAFDHLTAPVWCAGRAFFTWREPDGEHPRLVLVDQGTDTVRVLVDPLAIDPSGKTALGYWSPSPDGRWLAYQHAPDGAEEFTLRVMAVDGDVDCSESLAGCRYASVAWMPGTDSFYYVHEGTAGPRVLRHLVGNPFESDAVVFGSQLTQTEDLDIAIDPEGTQLLVSITTGLSAGNQLSVGTLTEADLDRPVFTPLVFGDGSWTGVWPGRNGRLYLLTDAGAPRGRLLILDGAAGRPRCVVPQDDHATLESFAVLGETGDRPELLCLWSRDGISTISRHDAVSGAHLGMVPLPGEGIVVELTFGNGTGDEVWFTYSDRVTPETVYRYRRSAPESVPWRMTSSVPVPAVSVSTEEYRSVDGTMVRMLLVRPAQSRGPLPAILQGYGAFGVSQVADYYAAALAWAGRGGLFAVACVRGGGEHGEDWHQAGMREHKQRGIEDFLGAAEHLVATGQTRPAVLGAFGQSAGGLLVAAAMNQRPELFAAAACTAAPLDMARYELTGMGPVWTEEFGSRNNPDELDWLLGYSPYHRIRQDVEYPAVLLTAFDQDTRVSPLHSRKMCAALQQRGATGGRPILLRREPSAGHGERDRSGRLAYFADILAFFAINLSLHREK